MLSPCERLRSGFWAFGCCVHPKRAARREPCCCYATVGNVLLKTECCKKILIYIYFFLNSHAYYYTESKSNTWLSVSAVRKKPQDFLLVEREHRLKDVIKTRKLQDRLVLPWTPPRKVTLYSLGSCFGFIGFVQALFLSAQGIIDYKGAFCQLVCRLDIVRLDNTVILNVMFSL